MSHTFLGPIVKCQVSAQALIRDGRYLDDDIVDAQELHLSPDGVVGWCDGRAVLHHHHRLNPRRRVWRPKRLLSIGFTGHYDAMSDRFGSVEFGCAAENIIVQHSAIVTVDDLAAGIQIRSEEGEVIVDLEPAAVANPCVPYTKYLLNDEDADDETVAPNRAFLEDGMRGFVLGLGDIAAKPTEGTANPTEDTAAEEANGSSHAVTIRPGDELWIVDPI